MLSSGTNSLLDRRESPFVHGTSFGSRVLRYTPLTRDQPAKERGSTGRLPYELARGSSNRSVLRGDSRTIHRYLRSPSPYFDFETLDESQRVLSRGPCDSSPIMPVDRSVGRSPSSWVGRRRSTEALLLRVLETRRHHSRFNVTRQLRRLSASRATWRALVVVRPSRSSLLEPPHEVSAFLDVAGRTELYSPIL